MYGWYAIRVERSRSYCWLHEHTKEECSKRNANDTTQDREQPAWCLTVSLTIILEHDADVCTNCEQRTHCDDDHSYKMAETSIRIGLRRQYTRYHIRLCEDLVQTKAP